MTNSSPRILGIGGGTRPGSSAERYLQLALSAAEKAGATTTFLGAHSLHLPLYEPSAAADGAAQQLVEELRRADGIIIASPGYHGTVSGFMKNALDYAEETRSDKRPYFSERAVGCMAVAGGWQAAVGTIGFLEGDRACPERVAHPNGRRHQHLRSPARFRRHMSIDFRCAADSAHGQPSR